MKISLEYLQEEWQKDCKLDELNLGGDSTKQPELHAKYLNYLTTLKLQARKAKSTLLSLRRLKWQYYRGELDHRQLNELGWEQYLGNAPLNNQMNDYLDTDPDVIKQTDKVEYLDTCLLQCESILKAVGSRGFDIRNAIEWTKFTNGLL